MIDVNSNLPLRRALVGGLRRGDVEVALAEMRLTARWLQNQVEAARDRSNELERELASTRGELDTLRARENEVAQAMGSAHRRAAEIEEAAEARARSLVGEAERTAASLAADVERRTDEARLRLEELLALKDTLLQSLRSVARDFDGVIGRIDRGESIGAAPAGAPTATAPPPAATAPPPASTAPQPAMPAAAPRPPRTEAPAAVVAGDERVFDARVEVDAGPFSDFASLSAFERALGRMPKVEDVYVRRFHGDRAVIELTLTEPSALLASLRECVPYAVSVDDADSNRLALTVQASSAAAAQ